mgnify:CR=1 FL=1
MGRLVWATGLPIIDGLGYAIIEVEVQTWLGYLQANYLLSWFTKLASTYPYASLIYYLGMFIVLGLPWVYWRNLWLWLYSTTIAFWTEDIMYWVLAWEYPHTWGCGLIPHICIYYVWDGIPIDYLVGLALVSISLFMYLREVVIEL